MSKKKRIVIGAALSTIEPLGPLYLSAIARQEGWEPHVVLGTGDYSEIEEAVMELEPDILGFSQFTGNHLETESLFRRIRERRPDIELIVGGPHPTAAPRDSTRFADYVVFGEGFHALRTILRGEAERGIINPTLEPFPVAYREQFYRDSPVHGKNAIKNIITGTGCPFRCTYCYNSNSVDDVKGDFAGEEAKFAELKKVLGNGRTFSRSKRTVDSVVEEVDDILRLDPETQMLFFQDDIFGAELPWLREFKSKYQKRLPFHLMTRFELVNPNKDSGREMLDLLAESGCNGLTLAIESADPTIRREVLRRNTPQEIIFDTMAYISELGLATRTFSMIGLPYGATRTPTKVGLEADLDTLKLSVDLKRETGQPTISWFSIMVPYANTQLDLYAQRHGHFNGDHSNIEEWSYRKGSVMRFVNRWFGPHLAPDTRGVWLEGEAERLYLAQLKDLMCYAPAFAHVPEGHVLARNYLEGGDLSPNGLERTTMAHLDTISRMNGRGNWLADPKTWLTPEGMAHYADRLEVANPYSALASQVPEGDALMMRFMDRGHFSPEGFNNATRFHLYDRPLYQTEKGPYVGEAKGNLVAATEFAHTYPVKLDIKERARK
tara:strand:+ start:582 stop:2402 length:1821 start_codon:yes stop_codon:yes gene_type:complete